MSTVDKVPVTPPKRPARRKRAAPQPVTPISKTLRVEVTTFEEVPVTYWQFRMELDGRIWNRESGSYEDGWVAGDYFMTILEDNRGRPWVSFFSNAHYAEDALESKSWNDGELDLTWGVFARAARRVLDGDVGAEASMSGNGGFTRQDADHVVYTTACAAQYRLTTETLEALLA